MTRPAATTHCAIDDDRVRVTRFDFEPGAETGWHRHELDYVICTISDCPMVLEEQDGKTRTVFVPAGTTYRRLHGVEHNVINGSDRPMSFVEIELKELGNP